MGWPSSKKLFKNFIIMPGIGVFVLTVASDLAANKANNLASISIPATLSPPVTSPSSTGINTPEYVIIRSREVVNFSSETSGSVLTLPFEEGSTFKKGDVLLTLDCRLQHADFKKAIAAQQATTQAYESAKKLKTYGSISDFEVVKAKSDADAANADLEKLKVIIEKCSVMAPFNGAVAEIKAHLHDTVKPGDPLLKIINTDDLIFEIQIPSSWLSWLHVGTVMHVHINDINKTILAKVTYVNPEIEPISQTVKITSTIFPSDPALKPGMSGQAEFPDNPNNKKGSKES